jgi:hypothetical protein
MQTSRSSSAEWLIPFKGRNPSGAYNQNFLWRHGSTYVMDNHRAALWCWLQHLDLESPHSFFHIDRHFDCLGSRLDEWLAHLPQSWNKFSIQEYLNHSYEIKGFGLDKKVPLFRWDNYGSIYLAVFGEALQRCYFATHHDDDRPNFQRACFPDLWDLPGNLDFWLEEEGAKPWVVNIFWHEHESPRIMVSEQYLEKCLSAVRRKMEDQTVAVTTIALTPTTNFTGGWASSEELAQHVLALLGIDFRLP